MVTRTGTGRDDVLIGTGDADNLIGGEGDDRSTGMHGPQPRSAAEVIACA